MARHPSFFLVVLAAGSLLAACDGGGTSSTETTSTTTSTTTGGGGGAGGEGATGGGGAGGGGATGGGGAGGSSAVCGDGVVADAEPCDDGDTDAGDGCDDLCTIEDGFTCAGEPSTCSTACGDGVTAGDEACDDANTDAGDGCDDLCATEPGYACAGEPSACAPICGDGLIIGPEACDDGGTSTGDGCDDLCATEPGYACTGAPSACAPVCGDGLITLPEECDDTDTAAGDGCDDLCAVENGFVCLGEPSTCGTVCSDGIIAGAEGCDDGDAIAGDGCDSTCTIEIGYACAGEPSACSVVCGDGVIVAMETCDDGDATPGDGCGATCTAENGYTCTGMPSTCSTTCGDAILAGAEACDDGNATPGDGCGATCAAENGYTCTGVPSVCVTTCGDGIVAGTEQCDDGNTVSGDGCSVTCTPNTGETCADPLVMSQATQSGAKYTWTVPYDRVIKTDGEFACDPNTHGPDVVVSYTKTSDTLANGGQLLHVKANTPLSTATAAYLNVEVKGGACAAGQGTSHKCLWYKDNWDAYLDVPPGTYFIWVQKNSPTVPGALFPAVTIDAEEIAAAAAEGEGCFAPYTSASAIYTPPGGAGQPHTWTLPASVNSFDMGVTWGAPGSISCDNTAPYGDIHGADAVVEYSKISPISVLKVDVQNLDPALTQSNLNVEVLSVCDPTSAAKVSRNCRANKDAFSFTAPSPAGPVYLWVSTEATSQEMNGASVQVTEIFPAIGESWPTAEPLSASGPITPTSMQRLDAPSCFPAGNIHWYKYTLVKDAMSFSPNVAGAVGVYDEFGQEKACVAAAAAPVGLLGSPGSTLYIAVQSPGPITSVTLVDASYNGVGAIETDMLVTFPSSPYTEFGMAVSATELFMGDTEIVFAFPKTGGSTAVEYGTNQGIPYTHLAYDLVFAGGSLFSVDDTTSGNASRLFRIYDGTTWGTSMAWDLGPLSYPAASPSHAIATDGIGLFMATRRTSTNASFYSFSTSAPGMPTWLGTNDSVWYVVGMAVDDKYFYVASNGVAGEGVYRVARANVAAAALKIASVDTGMLCTNIEVDAFVSPQTLYVRSATGDVHAVADPAVASTPSTGPVHVGAISTLGLPSDYAMTYDKAGGALYLFETEVDPAGRIVRIE
jgi:cysteine-rich repeat protein